jgi:hypothetical protein
LEFVNIFVGDELFHVILELLINNEIIRNRLCEVSLHRKVLVLDEEAVVVDLWLSVAVSIEDDILRD